MVFINTFSSHPKFKSVNITIDNISNFSEQGKLLKELQKLRTIDNVKTNLKNKTDTYKLNTKINSLLSLVTATVIIYGLIKIR